jgi:hypothetical protein
MKRNKYPSDYKPLTPEQKKRKADRNREYYKQNPWKKIFFGCRYRCKNDETYTKKSIKCLITVDEIKRLWFRDKAWLLKKPSIDRRDSNCNYEYSNCNYEYSNCRFIELSQNSNTSKLKINDILKIRKMYLKRDITYKEIGDIYGITPSGIGVIVRRKTWRNV